MPPEEEDSHQRMTRLKAGLKRIDAGSFQLTKFETEFLETCIRGYSAGRYLSERQIPIAEQMIRKYADV